MIPLTVDEVRLVRELVDRLGLGDSDLLTLSRNRADDLNVLVESIDTIYNVTLIQKAHRAAQ